MLIDKNHVEGCRKGETYDNNSKDISNSSGQAELLMDLSAFSLQGRRDHMEDFYDIGYQMKPEEQRKAGEWPYEYFYFGIFDGHGGSNAAKFAKERLLKFITKQPEFWSDNDDDVLRAIQIGYAKTHAAMNEAMHSWPRTHRFLPSTAGTTASVLFIKNGKFYTGHVGDSRIVISRRDNDSKQWIPHQITEDHKPESEEETARIRRAGGDVKSKVGVHRVVWRRPVLTSDFFDSKVWVAKDDGTDYDLVDVADAVKSYPVHESFISSYQIIPFLAIARSLGDFWSINPYSGQYIVSPEPDVSCRPINLNDECILLATDGLWSVVSSQQAIRALEEFKICSDGQRTDEQYAKQYFSIDNFYNVKMQQKENANSAMSLVYLASQVWERRSLRSDNITVVVAMLGDILTPQKNNICKRTNYRTRSNSFQNQTKSQSISDYIDANTIQIKYTRKFNETISLNQMPRFETEILNDNHINTMERLVNLLMLPPSAMPSPSVGVKIVAPKNFARLAEAEVQKIRHPNGYGNILIRRLSDDSLDNSNQLERAGKKPGIKIRDASAQCTQSVHDFAVPWPGESDEDDEEDEDAFIDSRSVIKNLRKMAKAQAIDRAFLESTIDEIDKEDAMDLELSSIIEDIEEHDDDIEHEDDEGNDEDEDIDEHDDDEDVPKLDNDEDEGVDGEVSETEKDVLLYDSIDLDVWPRHNSLAEVSEPPNTRRRSSQKEHMLQPRSENCDESPNYRRKTRSGAYLSLTGDPKLKLADGSPKAKRRKSHPLQCQI